MSELNTILRRLALCLTLLPALVGFMAFGLVVIFPLVIFISWASGSRTPLRDALEAMALDEPVTLFGDAWRGKPTP